MAKTMKSVLALTLTVIMLLSMSVISVSAAYTPNGEGYIDYTMTVGSEDEVEPSTSVEVPIVINQALGLKATTINIKYDSTYIDYQADSIYPDRGWSASSNAVAGEGSEKILKMTMYRANGKAYNLDAENYEVCTVTFDIKADAPAGTVINLTPVAADTNLSKSLAADSVAGNGIVSVSGTYTALNAGTITIKGDPVPADKKIESFVNPTETVEYNTAVDALNVPTEVVANLEGGTTENIPVTFDVSAYDPTKTDAPQVFNGTLGALPTGVVNTDGLVPTYTVTVQPQAVAADISIQAENKEVTFEGGEVDIPFTIAGSDSANGVTSVGLTLTLGDNETFAGIKAEGEADFTLGTEGKVASGNLVANVTGKTVKIAMVNDGGFNAAEALPMFTLKLTVAGNEGTVAIVDEIAIAVDQVVAPGGNDVTANVKATNPTVTITPENRMYTMGDVRNVLCHYVGLEVADFDEEWLDINDDDKVDLVDAVLILEEIESYTI